MPSMVDSIKVGNKIKELLKLHKMTQDELAQKLYISKSAVSQNLRGKSVFDIQNLIKIAEIFEITLDELLELNTESSTDVISHFQKMVQKGVASFKDTSAKDLRVFEPDIYGKVLVDYIILERQKEMFMYLMEHEVICVEPQYHRAAEIYLKMIQFMLEEKIEFIVEYIGLYTALKGSFQISDATQEMMIWGLLNQVHFHETLKKLIQHKTNTFDKFFKWQIKRMVAPLAKVDYMNLIAKYHLKIVLEIFAGIYNNDTSLDYRYFVLKMVETKFYDGILIFNNIYFTKEKTLNWASKMYLGVQEAALAIAETGQEKLILDFIKKGLYQDLTPIAAKLVTLKENQIVSYVIAQHQSELDFKKLGKVCIETSNLTLFESILGYLKKDDLDYLLSCVKVDDIKTMIYLFKHGGRIDEKYYNLETFKRINYLLESLIVGDKE